MGRNWGLKTRGGALYKLKSQLQLLYATMAPYGLDLGVRDSKQENKEEVSEKMRENGWETRGYLAAALMS